MGSDGSVDRPPILTVSFASLVRQEEELTANAEDRLGSFVDVVKTALGILNKFIVAVSDEHFVSAALQLALQKTAMLAYLSYVRKHHAQAEFNTRQTIEYCTLCAYMLAHPQEDMLRRNAADSQSFKPPKAVSVKAYKWLESSFPRHSTSLKDAKEHINGTAAHASVYMTRFTFNWDSSEGDAYHGSFFDNLSEDVEQLYLVGLASVLLMEIDVLRLVAEKYGGFELRDGLMPELILLEQRIDQHRAELGSGLVDHSQKMTVAASAMVEKKTVGHRS